MTPTQAQTQRIEALERLAQANVQRAACNEAYRAALIHAAATGASYSEIGRTLGIHRVSARQAVIRAQNPIHKH